MLCVPNSLCQCNAVCEMVGSLNPITFPESVLNLKVIIVLTQNLRFYRYAIQPSPKGNNNAPYWLSRYLKSVRLQIIVINEELLGVLTRPSCRFCFFEPDFHARNYKFS